MVDKMVDGWDSKKFWFVVGAVLVAFAFAALAGSVAPEMRPMYDSFLGFLEFSTGGYVFGNLVNKLVVGRIVKKAAEAIDPEPEPDEPAPKPQ